MNATHLRDLDDVQEKGQDMTFMMKMNGPGNKCAMIWRRPCIGSKMYLTRMVLRRVSDLPRKYKQL